MKMGKSDTENEITNELSKRSQGNSIEPVKYRRKGYGRVVCFLIIFSFFYYCPDIGKTFWPKELPNNTRLFNYLSIYLIHQIIFFLCNSIMFIIYWSKISFFENYRIHNEPWPWEKNKQEWNLLLKETICFLFINQFVILTIAGLIIFVRKEPLLKLTYDTLPNSYELIWQIIFLLICEDFCFYWSHRILHINKLYPIFHKIHHKYTNVIGISAENAHPVEFLLGNILPTQSGVFLLGGRLHLFTNILWIIIRITKTTDAHCGYDFSWSPFSFFPYFTCSDFHNFHHLKYKGNYGSFLTIWDHLCGTVNNDYRIFKEKRNKLS